jgi:hypothetical protein
MRGATPDHSRQGDSPFSNSQIRAIRARVEAGIHCNGAEISFFEKKIIPVFVFFFDVLNGNYYGTNPAGKGCRWRYHF